MERLAFYPTYCRDTDAELVCYLLSREPSVVSTGLLDFGTCSIEAEHVNRTSTLIVIGPPFDDQNLRAVALCAYVSRIRRFSAASSEDHCGPRPFERDKRCKP